MNGISRQLPRRHVQNSIIFERKVRIPEDLDFPAILNVGLQLATGIQMYPQGLKNILTAYIAVDDREGTRL